MQLREVLDDVAVDLQVSLLDHPLGAHHVAQVAVPLLERRPLVFGIAVDDLRAQAVDVAPVGAYQVLHLPHVQQIFGNVLLFQLFGNIHVVRQLH